MRIFLATLLLLLTTTVFGQFTQRNSLQSVQSVADAQQFVQDHTTLQPVLLELDTQRVASSVDRQLYLQKKGSIVTIGNYSYKIVADTVKYAYRASYIYLDGTKLSRASIDSIRTLILQQLTAGVPFGQLADAYTMDGNPYHGDLGVFEAGIMVKEFEEAVRQHANGKVFTVDIPDRSWFYVVKKTADNHVKRTMTVLKVKNI
jgi:parvulin-like peptidyl-prolyl isomerase